MVCVFGVSVSTFNLILNVSTSGTGGIGNNHLLVSGEGWYPKKFCGSKFLLATTITTPAATRRTFTISF